MNPLITPLITLTLAACAGLAVAQLPGTTAADLKMQDAAIHWPKEFAPSTAVIFSHNEALIDADCGHVFAVLANVTAWPEWLIFTREAHVDGPDQSIRQGTLIHLTMFGGQMDTLITEYAPGARLAWSPRGSSETTAQHYHNWLFVQQRKGCNVITEESGISADDRKRVAANDTTMHRAHDLWLASLKWASENDTKHLFKTN